ncbi:DUF484 family protein [Plastorhodobacter daqingensis]|uniref:DUF484 family protein n=1 Tax=Plastorhodobacter daqingensis TaxID=1387281 RepID=A0ABW2UN06_9RHOB
MTDMPNPTDDLRDRILARPDAVLDDPDVMRALIAASGRDSAGKVIDLRGVAMERLEARMGRLEDTHRSVIAAAYDNLASTNQIHRAVLRMLDPIEPEAFLHNLRAEVADILRVDQVRLVLEQPGETTAPEEQPPVRPVGDILCHASPGFIDFYITGGRNLPIRSVTLRQGSSHPELVYGEVGTTIRSEAMMKLDLGPDRLPGLLLMGAEDPRLFKPSQGTELLAFFAGVLERTLRRWPA